VDAVARPAILRVRPQRPHGRCGAWQHEAQTGPASVVPATVRCGRPLLQARAPVVLTECNRQDGLTWLARRITGPAASHVAS